MGRLQGFVLRHIGGQRDRGAAVGTGHGADRAAGAADRRPADRLALALFVIGDDANLERDAGLGAFRRFQRQLVRVRVGRRQVPEDFVTGMQLDRVAADRRALEEVLWDPVCLDAWPSRPSAVAPLIVTDLPLPAVPAPKQLALGLVLIVVVPVLSVCSVSTLLPLPTTRSSVETPLASALAANGRDSARASAHAAASRNGMSLGI